MEYDKIKVYGIISLDSLGSVKDSLSITTNQLKIFFTFHLKMPEIYQALKKTLSQLNSFSVSQIYTALDSQKFIDKLRPLDLHKAQRTTNNRLTSENIMIAKAALLVEARRLLTMQEISRIILMCSLLEIEIKRAGIPATKEIINRILKQCNLVINPKCIEQFLARSRPFFRTTDREKKMFLADYEKWEIWKMKEAEIAGVKQVSQKLTKIDIVLTVDQFIFLSANAESRSGLLDRLPPFIPKWNKESPIEHTFPVDPDNYIREQFLVHNKGLNVQFQGLEEKRHQQGELNDTRPITKLSYGKAQKPLSNPSLYNEIKTIIKGKKYISYQKSSQLQATMKMALSNKVRLEHQFTKYSIPIPSNPPIHKSRPLTTKRTSRKKQTQEDKIERLMNELDNYLDHEQGLQLA